MLLYQQNYKADPVKHLKDGPKIILLSIHKRLDKTLNGL